MAHGRIATMEINELIRLARAGESSSTIARVLGLNRRTVIRYRGWASEQGLLTGEAPDAAALQRLITTTLPSVPPPQQTSTVAVYGEEIARMRERGMEIAAIRSRLEERHGGSVSYSAVWRFVRHLEPKTPEAVVRIEVPLFEWFTVTAQSHVVVTPQYCSRSSYRALIGMRLARPILTEGISFAKTMAYILVRPMDQIFAASSTVTKARYSPAGSADGLFMLAPFLLCDAYLRWH
jgi:hypothetical protein